MKQNILIAMPTYRGTIQARTMVSIIGSIQKLNSEKISCDIMTMDNTEIVPARNILVAEFLKNSKFSHILFIDDDISFRSDVPLRLLTSNKSIIGVACPWRAPEPRFNINMLPGPVKIENGIIEVEYIGTGILLIERSALQKMIESGAVKEAKRPEYKTENVFGFFNHLPSVELSEDFAFCFRWRNQCGGAIYAIIDEVITHTGSYNYTARAIDHGSIAKL